VGAPLAGCHSGGASSEPPPAAPEAAQVPPDSPLAQIKPDMTAQEVASILGEPYASGEYVTGKAFIPFYNSFGGDNVRFAWRYRGIGRVIFSRHNAYVTELHVVKVEYDPQEGGGPPPAAPASPPEQAAASDESAPPPPEADQYADNDPSALTDFRSTLDPYGQWVDDPVYGTVWVPTAGPEFAPYSTGGHWVHDDSEGWVWVSDYDWGAIPFHYGRWVLIGGRGWGWIPGRVYRGAWVNFEVDDGYAYMGWAPSPPEFIWVGGAPIVRPLAIAPRFVYVPRAEVFSPVVGTRVLVGPAALSVSPRMHVLAPEGPGRAFGPRPERFGYTAERVPHPSPAEHARLTRAREMARPSTAQRLGAHPPTRSASTNGRPSDSRAAGPVRGPQPAAEPHDGPHAGAAEPHSAVGEPRAGASAPHAGPSEPHTIGEPRSQIERAPAGAAPTNPQAERMGGGAAAPHAAPTPAPRPAPRPAPKKK
jgi:hypothetical protein